MQEVYSFLLIFFVTISFLLPVQGSLKVNIFTHMNGKGLDTDAHVLKEALESLHCHVKVIDFLDSQWNKAHINIFIQNLFSEKFPMAKFNFFIPNPEWYDQSTELLERIDLILCRTHEVERIFKNLKLPTYYLGFTSPDCYKQEIKKNYHHLFHLAGGSHLKGTEKLKELWLGNTSLPILTVLNFLNPYHSKRKNLEWISERIPQEDLRSLQNACGLHLCPSKTEGFGHYIMEALSAASVVVTIDAPPMNEFIGDARCLIPYTNQTQLHLGTCYDFNPKIMEKKLKSLLRLSDDVLAEIGMQNRIFYLQKKHEFYQKLQELIVIFQPLSE